MRLQFLTSRPRGRCRAARSWKGRWTSGQASRGRVCCPHTAVNGRRRAASRYHGNARWFRTLRKEHACGSQMRLQFLTSRPRGAVPRRTPSRRPQRLEGAPRAAVGRARHAMAERVGADQLGARRRRAAVAPARRPVDRPPHSSSSSDRPALSLESESAPAWSPRTACRSPRRCGSSRPSSR